MSMAAGGSIARPRVRSEERRRYREALKRDFFNLSLFEERYRAVKIIGEGAYGVVCKAADVRTGEEVAVKRVRRVLDSSAKATRALREIKFLRLLSRHRNIIEVRDILEPGERSRFMDIFIVFELMRTDLDRLLRSESKLEEKHIKFLMFQLLCAVHFMHSAHVLHRDLNPRNILVDEYCALRICDFGLARASFQRNDDFNLWTDYVATRYYRAPELILSESTKYSTALDMWSVGCIFAELLGRKPLFPGRNGREQFELITRVVRRPSDDFINSLGHPHVQEILRRLPPRPKEPLSDRFPHATPDAIELLEALLEFDASKRISAIQALASPYFAEYRPIDLGPRAGPLHEAEFAFEKGQLNVEQMRYEFLKEIAGYHPERASEILAPLRHDGRDERVGVEGVSVGVPSPGEKFGIAMCSVDRNIPVKDRSLPQAYFVSENPQEAVRPSVPDFRSSTFGERDMSNYQGSETMREQKLAKGNES